MDINNIPKEILDQIPPEFLDNLDQLMQETRKPVFGEKVIEEHLPTLCRQAAAEGIVLLKNQGGAPAPAEGCPRGCVWTGAAGLLLRGATAPAAT